MSGERTVLVIDDEAPIRRLLRLTLEPQGYRLYEAGNGQLGLQEAAARRPDVIILDLGLPDMEGVEVIRAVREWSAMPIIILSARSAEQSKIEALDAGADDYLTKPFGLGELLARTRVVLRHWFRMPEQNPSGVFTTGNLQVDLMNRWVLINEEEVHLTPIQFRLLSVLVQNAGKVLTHRQILKDVWGPSHTENSHYLRIYMSQLRQKLEVDPTQPKYLLTESGVGYRLKV